MMKYIKLLETRAEYYLPLIDKFEDGKVNCNFQIPLSFYIKYKVLFEESKSYISLFEKTDIEKHFKKNSFQSYESWLEAGNLVGEYDSIDEELYWVIQEYNKIDFKASNVDNLISILLRILRLLKEVYPHNKDIYEKSIIKFKTASKELKKISSIIYDKNAIKYKKEFLPDSWFILPNQILYNTGNGHKESNLTYDFYYTVHDVFKDKKSLNGIANYYQSLIKEIKENGFTSSDFKTFLNLAYYPVYTDTSHEFPTCHEKHILDHIIGIITAKVYFYHFFEKMQNYCLNPKEEFDKLKKMTNNEITDVFVRCCGFHKIESQLEKTITTSDVNYRESFKEYINNGWNIVFIPPIIIQRDLGIIKELDMESPFVKKYIK